VDAGSEPAVEVLDVGGLLRGEAAPEPADDPQHQAEAEQHRPNQTAGEKMIFAAQLPTATMPFQSSRALR
jgi:hypothetical protein